MIALDAEMTKIGRGRFQYILQVDEDGKEPPIKIAKICRDYEATWIEIKRGVKLKAADIEAIQNILRNF